MRTKQYSESKKVSKVEKEKKCKTSEQRSNRYTRFLKTAGVATLLATAGMAEATKAESNKATELADRMQHPSKSLPERYVPTDQDGVAHEQFLDRLNHPPFYFNPP